MRSHELHAVHSEEATDALNIKYWLLLLLALSSLVLHPTANPPGQGQDPSSFLLFVDIVAYRLAHEVFSICFIECIDCY